MSGSLRWLSKHMIRLVVYGSFGAALVLLVAAVFYLDSREDLSPWHTEILDLEFQANSDVDSLQQYLVIEEQLFAELDAVLRTEPVSPADRLNRFRPGSLSDPDRWSPNGNRTFILDAPDPPAAALLLHGMSDSPYSLRSVAEALNNAGVFVIGLRLPGHGTAPSGLVEVSWQDMAAAVQLAAKHIGLALSRSSALFDRLFKWRRAGGQLHAQRSDRPKFATAQQAGAIVTRNRYYRGRCLGRLAGSPGPLAWPRQTGLDRHPARV